MPQIIILLDGGIIHQVIADEAVDVTIIDYDTDGIPEEELQMSPDGDLVMVYDEEPIIDREEVEEILEWAREEEDYDNTDDPFTLSIQQE